MSWLTERASIHRYTGNPLKRGIFHFAQMSIFLLLKRPFFPAHLSSQSAQISFAGKRHKRGTCIKVLFWPPQEPKAENCFSPISFDWFIRRITDVLNCDIYLNFTVAMVTKMADTIGLKQRNCHFGPNFRLLETDCLTAKYKKSF